MNYLLCKRTLIAIWLCLVLSSTYAYDFEVDGIYYNVISMSELTCEVVDVETEYMGEMTIPNQLRIRIGNFKL